VLVYKPYNIFSEHDQSKTPELQEEEIANLKKTLKMLQ